MSDAKSLNSAINDLVAFGGGCAGAAYSLLAEVNQPIPQDHPLADFLLYLLYAMIGGFVSLLGKKLADVVWTKVSRRLADVFSPFTDRDNGNAE